MGGLLVGAALTAAGAGQLLVAWLGSQRRLRPGSVVGVRLRSTTRDEHSWHEAQQAAASPLGLGGGVAATCGVGVVATGLDVVGVVLVVVALSALAVGALGGWIAGARSVRPPRGAGG